MSPTISRKAEKEQYPDQEQRLMAIHTIVPAILFTVVGNYDSIFIVVIKANLPKERDAKLWV